MVPGKANQRVIADRLDWVQRMVDEVRSCRSAAWTNSPLTAGTSARQNPVCEGRWSAAGSGRHLLAKVFGEAVTEYKKIAEELDRRGYWAPDSAHQLRVWQGIAIGWCISTMMSRRRSCMPSAPGKSRMCWR